MIFAVAWKWLEVANFRKRRSTKNVAQPRPKTAKGADQQERRPARGLLARAALFNAEVRKTEIILQALEARLVGLKKVVRFGRLLVAGWVRGFLRLAAKGRMTDEELVEELAGLEETRRTAQRELELLRVQSERYKVVEHT